MYLIQECSFLLDYYNFYKACFNDLRVLYLKLNCCNICWCKYKYVTTLDCPPRCVFTILEYCILKIKLLQHFLVQEQVCYYITFIRLSRRCAFTNPEYCILKIKLPQHMLVQEQVCYYTRLSSRCVYKMQQYLSIRFPQMQVHIYYHNRFPKNVHLSTCILLHQIMLCWCRVVYISDILICVKTINLSL